jgi:hypothetical protein
MSICRAGSHYAIEEPASEQSQGGHGEPSADPSALGPYADWLNEEKFKERKEFLKFILTLAVSVLAFTVSFRKDVIGSEAGTPVPLLLKAFWLLLLASIVLAMIYYFLEYRYIFYLRLGRAQVMPPWNHYAGKVERLVYSAVVYLTPIAFIAGLILLTSYVVGS